MDLTILRILLGEKMPEVIVEVLETYGHAVKVCFIIIELIVYDTDISIRYLGTVNSIGS